MQHGRAEMLAERTHRWAVVAAACFGLLMLRLGWIQLVQHSYYLDKARRTIGRHEKVPAPRGEIRDRNNLPLALNLKLYSISADPKLMGDLPTAAEKLAPELCLPKEQLLARLTGEDKGRPPSSAPLRFVRLRENVDKPTAEAIAALKLPGVIIQGAVKRAYPKGSIGAALIGFVGEDSAGLSGIEERFNKVLAGKSGEDFIMLDPRSRGDIPGSPSRSSRWSPATTWS